MKNLTKFFIPIAIIIAGLLIVGGVFYTNKEKLKALSPQQAAASAISFVNKIIASQGATTTASLIEVTDTNGVYKLRFTIEKQEYTSYVTKDGKFLFPEGYDLNPTTTSASGTTGTNESGNTTCESLKKVDKPILEAFIVSNCPFGLQMQRILYEIVSNIPSLAENMKVEYLGAIQGNKIVSMHGDNEAQENLRQICIREEQNDKYWSYVGCYLKKGDADGCLNVAKLDKSKLNICMTDTTKGIEYAKADFAGQDKYGVSGSPTLFLNGEKVNEFDFGGRTAEAVKTLICCGSQEKPDVCSQVLATSSAAVSFSETYVGSGTSNNSASCGQ